MKKVILFPGQGSQFRGMGQDLFKSFPKLTQQASRILGYAIDELCLLDKDNLLSQTEYTQPALYVVNALNFLKHFNDKKDKDIAFSLGHSLGEYNALHAAGLFDFETGLKLVQKRGQLMGSIKNGGMAAIVGLTKSEIEQTINSGGYNDIDIANHNTPTQIVISGTKKSIHNFEQEITKCNGKFIPLNVSAAFHSRHMKKIKTQFLNFVNTFTFNELLFPVIANFDAKPYTLDRVSFLLSEQLTGQVNWVESIRYILHNKTYSFHEVNSRILTKMVTEIQHSIETTPIPKPIITSSKKTPSTTQKKVIPNTFLGNKEFCKKYSIKYPYLAGAMYRGINSKEMVVRMGSANLISFLGTGGMSLEDISTNIDFIQQNLNNQQSYGMNLLCNITNPSIEEKTVDLYIKKHIKFIEAAAFMQITESLVWYRVAGLTKDDHGKIIEQHHILAKCSRPEVATEFLSPAPKRILDSLLKQQKITQEQFELAHHVPVSSDICIEADSGGHTDMGIPGILFPVIKKIKDDMIKKFNYKSPIYLGLAGGIGTPETAAMSFLLGADFILTGSINQCSVEANQSDIVKDMLQNMNVQDTDYAPAGDMFELGAKIQVLKKGVFFPARAKKLFDLYHQFDSIDEIPLKIKQTIESQYFKKSFETVWEETQDYFIKHNLREIIDKATQSPKQKMALIFRWYFGYSSKVAKQGNKNHKVDFQIHTGPSLGAFNQWVKDTHLENWRHRHVDIIAKKIITDTESLFKERLQQIV
ncbi:[acyl-carrier-protein] S-malonyltransferase [Candidatus Marinamargulisbacteria bacterium SCGC AG-414-C22]|nr:[acyl-carrier-protein] S-malonyltransferase [Candidatus Marinamargulisbacteria bacterium SCGC AG-414-C22]